MIKRGLAAARRADQGDALARLDAEADVAQHPVGLAARARVAVREPDVLELDRAGTGAGSGSAAGARAPGRSRTAGSVSSSWKMRSQDAIDDCITEYLAERSRSGMKKRRIQSKKT